MSGSINDRFKCGVCDNETPHGHSIEDIRKKPSELESLRARNRELEAMVAVKDEALNYIKSESHGTPPFDINSGNQYIWEAAHKALSSNGSEMLDAVRKAKEALKMIESDYYKYFSGDKIYQIHASIAKEALAILERWVR